MISLRRLTTYATVLSLGYLTLPIVIFLAGWLWWPWAVALTALTLVAVCVIVRNVLTSESSTVTAPGYTAIPWYKLLIAAIPLTVAALLSGAGGYGPGNVDWLKHEAILHDLIANPWPVTYSLPNGGGSASLVYFLAYYLPAAVVGKIAGWPAANHVLFATTLLGLWILTLWLAVFFPKRPLVAALIFTFFSGMDVIGLLVNFHPQNPLVFLLQQYHIDRWTAAWEIPSHLTGIFWAPQHTLPAWLASALILHPLWKEERAFGNDIFLVGLLMLWSPFAIIGLAPLLLLNRIYGAKITRSQNSISLLPHVVGLVLLGLFSLYYLAHLQFHSNSIPLAPDEAALNGFGFFFAPNPPHDFAAVWGLLSSYIESAALEFGLLAMMIILCSQNLSRRKRLALFLCVIWLLILMLFRYGRYNDLIMRGSLPALFVLTLLTIQILPQLKTLPRLAIIALLLLGAMTPTLSLRYELNALSETRVLWQCPPEMDLLSAGSSNNQTDTFLSQYFGDNHAAFFRFFSRP